MRSLNTVRSGQSTSRDFSLELNGFNAETRMFYLVIAWDPRLAGDDPTATIEIAESLFEDIPPGPGATTTFRYDTYDTTGAVSTPGSYAFLSDLDDTSTVVTTYEGLRDGTTTALLIHHVRRRRRLARGCLRRRGSQATCSSGARPTTVSCATRSTEVNRGTPPGSTCLSKLPWTWPG